MGFGFYAGLQQAPGCPALRAAKGADVTVAGCWSAPWAAGAEQDNSQPQRVRGGCDAVWGWGAGSAGLSGADRS